MQSLQGKLSVERMCTLAEVSRAGFYRWLHKRATVGEEMTVRAAIQEIAVETSSPLRIPAHHGRTSPSRDGGEP